MSLGMVAAIIVSIVVIPIITMGVLFIREVLRCLDDTYWQNRDPE